jgi:hypothetical protein
MSELPRELEAFLAKPPSGRADDAFRDDVLQQSLVLLDRGRSRRKITLLFASYAAIILIGVVWNYFSLRQTRIQPPVAIMAPPAAVGVEEIVVPAPIAPTPSDPATLEWQAFDSPKEKRAELYWHAGKAYVAHGGDYVSATRCFRQALDAGPAELLQITEDDDILTTALKFERTRKENRNVDQ